MEWMLNNQDARRNLSAVDRLLAAEKLREKIAEEAAIKRKETEGRPSKENCRSIDPQFKKDTKFHTRKELAKIAGVSEAAVQRFSKIMKSDDEELKEKVKSGEMTITTQQHIEEMTLSF